MDINILQKIARILRVNDISWGLGASSMLHFHGLIETPRDIDLMVDEEDAEKAIALLSGIATSVHTDDGLGKYATKYFYEMVIEGQAVDLIGGYKIMRNDWIYDFPILKNMELEQVNVNEETIPLTRIEDWYIAYIIMGDPKSRVPKIENYVSQKGGFKFVEQIQIAIAQIQEKAPQESELIEKLQRSLNNQ